MDSDIDIEKLAREAGFSFNADHGDYPLDSTAIVGGIENARILAALVLEEAARKAESSVAEFGVNSEWTHGYVEGVKDCASGMRTFAEGLKK